MIIEQFYDKGLAHASYAIVSDNKMAIIDPGRDPQPYYDFAKKHKATILCVIETHPHADFISSHLEIAETTKALIYNSELTGADYPHRSFDEGDSIAIGKVNLRCLNTPGHSPDSICIVLEDEKGKDHAIFTGDTLFVGDVGRPDLREGVGNITAKKEELARQMYHSTRHKLMPLNKKALVYPAHGPGSLCGKGMSSELFSTMEKQLKNNYALQPMTEDEFVEVLLEGQPFMPKYFSYDVALNKKGAKHFEASIAKVKRLDSDAKLDEKTLIIDARPQAQFKAAHLKKAINLQDGLKFETWVGSIVGPKEKFYLIAEDADKLDSLIRKIAKIGYEINIKGALIQPDTMKANSPLVNINHFKANMASYTIVDIRNKSEYENGALFSEAINIPLPELRERIKEIPTDKPVMIHCAGGYRSAAGQSIVEATISAVPVYDLSVAINDFKQVEAGH